MMELELRPKQLGSIIMAPGLGPFTVRDSMSILHSDASINVARVVLLRCTEVSVSVTSGRKTFDFQH